MPKVPDLFCMDNFNVYIYANDNIGVGETVGSWAAIRGVCCEVGASEIAEAWGHSLKKVEALS